MVSWLLWLNRLESPYPKRLELSSSALDCLATLPPWKAILLERCVYCLLYSLLTYTHREFHVLQTGKSRVKTVCTDLKDCHLPNIYPDYLPSNESSQILRKRQNYFRGVHCPSLQPTRTQETRVSVPSLSFLLSGCEAGGSLSLYIWENKIH